MNSHPKFSLIALLLAGCALTSASYAANEPSDHHFDRSSDSHDTQAPSPPPESHHGAPSDVRGPAPSHEFRGPPPNFHSQAPSRDFHGAPPDFHGQLRSRDFRGPPPGFRGTPNVGDAGRLPHTPREHRNPQAFERSAPRDFRGLRSRTPGTTTPPAVSAFVDRHDVARFTPQQREAWTHGTWRHDRHHGHFGWWWNFNNFWFFYPEPFYPFPSFVGEYYDDEYTDDGYADDGYWYWCDEPRGYYPYIQECDVDWIPVPPQPY
jgi:hypothetical protein